ncbi:DUF1367 family protein [Agarivorans sp. B2Z047]|uniref:DUF1367 family protein n=1 Tax=Agarivorans sp. B2Z047 TaxID=2652721 RepID=UPI00128C4C3D|nr:DUF1367 family protein [Agarivorans sp. B2Z047]MPW31936.1 DUF1367 family protein [Agarivorans sp. B2Z047]UQN41905.1 DUF1367 family protein [Agarivorans sp. B2Z047]
MDINLIKHQGALFPATEGDREKLNIIGLGKVVTASLTQKRNYAFHKKFFAMLNIGFDAFEPLEGRYKGLPVQKNFTRFRKDVIIAAGYYEMVANINGKVRAEAKSISFGSMNEEEFQQLYGACCNVLLQKVLASYTREDLDRVVEQLIRF